MMINLKSLNKNITHHHFKIFFLYFIKKKKKILKIKNKNIK